MKSKSRCMSSARSSCQHRLSVVEEAGQTQERGYFPLKARQLAAGWEVRQRQTKLEKSAVRRQSQVDKCERYCRELRLVLRQQEDLVARALGDVRTQSRQGQLHDAVEARTGQCGDVGEGSVFWRKLSALQLAALAAIFQVGWLDFTTTTSEVQLELCAFNNRALVRDVEDLCRNVSTSGRNLARWQTFGDDRREASWVSTRRAAGAGRVSLTLDASIAQKAHSLFLYFTITVSCIFWWIVQYRW